MYRKTTRDKAPRKEHDIKSRFESTREWTALKADLDRGLNKDDVCQLRFGPADWERIGLSGEAQAGRKTSTGSKSIRRVIQKYITANRLEYRLRSLHSGGFDYVIVEVKGQGKTN